MSTIQPRRGNGRAPKSMDLATASESFRRSKRLDPMTLRAAQLTVARRSRGRDDLRVLLDMLGLLGEPRSLNLSAFD